MSGVLVDCSPLDRLLRGKGHQVQVRAGDSYLSSSGPRVHFGVGAATPIRRVVIDWPSGIVQEVRGVKPGRYTTIEESAGPR